MTSDVPSSCSWCGRPYRPRRGGSPRRFCAASCRTALRRWGERAIRAGVLTVADIKNGDPAACTLLLAATSVGGLDVARRHPTAPVARCATDSPQQKLELAMRRAIATRRRG
jgi:hypothetical protein